MCVYIFSSIEFTLLFTLLILACHSSHYERLHLVLTDGWRMQSPIVFKMIMNILGMKIPVVLIWCCDCNDESAGNGHCLLDAPPQDLITKEQERGQNQPGESFTEDRQCQLVFGETSKICSYMVSSVIVGCSHFCQS